MQCENVRAQLTALLDGELSEAALRAIRRHVNACGRCALELEKAERVKQLIDRSRVPETVSLVDVIMDRIAREAADDTATDTRPLRGVRLSGAMLVKRRAFPYLAAAAAIILLTLLTVHAVLKRPAESSVDSIVETAGSLFDDMSQAFAEAGRGMIVVPEDVARGATVAWVRIAENSPTSRLSNAVDSGGRLLEGGLEGVSSVLKRAIEVDSILTTFGTETAGP